MPYTVGMSISRGTKEVDRFIVTVDAENRKKATLKAEDLVDREYGPDYYSRALAVTESVSNEALVAA